ncbi:MAG TPA: questin oxidase family protein [Ideonella sp.]|uniref:questin oxidase family protein n=1 Tax=Ideonella sp. TaxID=1929293 RepID=UPI002E2F5982|nr:questin oxidase family protein [Ideonella sp.]HEX5685942.1 questin oxidase family protein [Ideonella sp.]
MPATPTTRLELRQALDASLAYAATYPAGRLRLSNHLPMVLTSLYRLHAPADALQTHLQRMAQKLAPLAPDSDDARLGRDFAGELERDGRAAVLARHLPSLLAASETAGFHGLIRLAFALDTDHTAELAQALAGWKACLEALGPPPPATGGPNEKLADVLQAASEAPTLASAPQHHTTIVEDMRRSTALPGFDDWVSGPRAPADAALTLDALAEASLAVYLASRDFTALHLVTGCHALRLVLPHARLDAARSQIVLRGVWRAWLAAWISIGRPAPDWLAVYLGGPASESDWQAALPALLAAANDHGIKLAWTALDEWRHRGWPGYARVLPTVQVQS